MNGMYQTNMTTTILLVSVICTNMKSVCCILSIANLYENLFNIVLAGDMYIMY